MSQLPRYESYKDSGVQWLGEIPSHWGVMRLKNSIVSAQNGVWGDEPKSDENDLYCLRVADFDRRLLTMSTDNLTIRNISEKDYLVRRLAVGDLLLEKSGGGDKQPVGFVVQNNFTQKAVCSNFVAKVVLKHNMDSRYWTYHHQVLYNARVNTRSIKQSTGIQNLDATLYFNELACFPPIEEQVLIALFLDKRLAQVDALIAKQETLLEKLAEQRVALISHAVTKGLNPDVKLQKSDSEILGLYPETWKVKRLRFEIETNPSKSEIQLEESELVSFIPMEAVSVGGGLDLTNERMISEVSSGYTYFADGDVVVAKITPCFENGKASVAENLHQGMAFGTTELHVLRCKKDLLNSFLFFIIQSDKFMKYGESEMYGAGGQKRVPERFIKDYLIALPPLDEQQEICDFIESQLSHLDGLVQKVESTISIFNEYRSTLITQVVTGKIDVRNLKVN